MSLPNRHIRGIGRVLILLFFLANSGFTLVLRHCTTGMMECRSASDGHMASACCMMDPPLTPGDHAFTAGNRCHSVEVAGGLKTDPTLVENVRVAHVTKLDMTGILTPSLSSSDNSAHFPHVVTTAPHTVSASPVETYVLNETFLI
jgi:hypothetical protein